MSRVAEIPENRLKKFRSIPLCLLCGTAEEAAALAVQLGIEKTEWRTDMILKKGYDHVFYFGSFGKAERKIDYYLASSASSRRSFAVQTTLLFHALRPRLALLVGACSALKGPGQSIAPGDVIFGDTAVLRWGNEWHVLASDDVVPSTDGKLYDMKSFVESVEETRFRYGKCLSQAPASEKAISSFSSKDPTSTSLAFGIDADAWYFLEICHLTQVSSLGIVKEVTPWADATSNNPSTPPKMSLKWSARAIKGLIKYQSPSLNQQIGDQISSAAATVRSPKELSESDPGVAACRGYYTNFIKVVLDSYRDGLPVTLKANPKVQLKGVRGLKIVMPPALQAKFYTDAGIFKHVLKEFCLQEVLIGTGRPKSLSYVGGYMIDFPSTINSLSEVPDSSLQVEKFQRKLQSEAYFADGHSASVALICSWKEFLDWLNEIDPTDEHIEPLPNPAPTTKGDQGASLPNLRQVSSTAPVWVVVVFVFLILSVASRYKGTRSLLHDRGVDQTGA